MDALFLNREGQNHENLIKVLRHGWLPTAEYYYIDMEICDFDLHTYIYEGDNCTVTRDGTPVHLQQKRGPYDIVKIAGQIAKGIEFIHNHNKVHRDLKPRNSKSSSVFRLITSSILPIEEFMEGCRLGARRRG